MRCEPGLPRGWGTPVGWASAKPLLCLTWPLEPCLVCRAEFILLPLSQAISALVIPRGLQLAAFPRNSRRVAEDSSESQQGSLAEKSWRVIPAAGLLAYLLLLEGGNLTGCAQRRLPQMLSEALELYDDGNRFLPAPPFLGLLGPSVIPPSICKQFVASAGCSLILSLP